MLRLDVRLYSTLVCTSGSASGRMTVRYGYGYGSAARTARVNAIAATSYRGRVLWINCRQCSYRQDQS